MPESRANRIWWIAGAAAVVLLSGILYLPTINSTTIWEDRELLSGTAGNDPQSVRDCFTKPFIYHYYRPLTLLSFYVERRMAGENPVSFHRTNVILHVFGTAFAIAFFAAAFRSRAAALIGGSLFAVQPVQFLTTAWIGGRTDTLCVLFAAIFGWALVRAVSAEGRCRLLWLLISLVGYVGAILAKEQALGLILLVPLAFRCLTPAEEIRQPRHGWLASIPFAAAATAFVLAWFTLAPPTRQEMPADITEQLGIAGRTILYAVTVLFIPSPRWVYDITLNGFQPWWCAAAGYAVVTGSIVLLLRWLRTAPRAAWMLAMALVTIAPVLNFMPMMSLLVAPFRAALTGLAVCGLVGWYAADRITSSPARSIKAAFSVAFAVYAVACGAVVFRSVQDWSSGVSVSEKIVQSNQLSVFAWLELGRSLLDENRYADAKAVLDSVAYNGLSPNEPRVARPVRMGEYDDFMAHLFVRSSYGLYNLGDQAAAREALQAAGEVAPRDLMVYLGKADLAYSDGDWKRSVEFLRLALAADPEMTDRRVARARILLGHGLHSEAKAEFEECLRRQPDLAAARTGLAFANYLVEHQKSPKK